MEKILDRLAKTSKVPPEYLSEKPPFPKHAKVEITTRCDLKCFFCSHTYKGIPQGDIDPGLLENILVQLRDLGCTDVGLFWMGEPFLVDALPDFVALAKRIGIPYVFLTTNGRMATPDRLQAVFDAGLDSLKFSLNADSRQSFLQNCGVDAFERVIQHVKAAATIRGKKTRPALYASTVFDPARQAEFHSVEQVIGPHVDQHYPLRLYGRNVFPDGETPLNMRSLAEMMPCWSLFTNPHISFDGKMSACYCDHDSRLYMADCREVGVLGAWHSERFVQLRRFHLERVLHGHVCEQCIAYNPG